MIKSCSVFLSTSLVVTIMAATVATITSHADENFSGSEFADALGVDPNQTGSGSNKALPGLPTENASCTADKKQTALRTLKKHSLYFKKKCESLSGTADDGHPDWAELTKMVAQKKQALVSLQPNHQSTDSILGNLRSGRWIDIFYALGLNDIAEENSDFKAKLGQLKLNYKSTDQSDLPPMLKPLLEINADNLKGNPEYFSARAAELEGIFVAKNNSETALLDTPHIGLIPAVRKLLEEEKAGFKKPALEQAMRKLNTFEKTIKQTIQVYRSYSKVRACQNAKGYSLWNRDWLIRKCGAESVNASDDAPCAPPKDEGSPLDEKKTTVLKKITEASVKHPQKKRKEEASPFGDPTKECTGPGCEESIIKTGAPVGGGKSESITAQTPKGFDRAKNATATTPQLKKEDQVQAPATAVMREEAMFHAKKAKAAKKEADTDDEQRKIYLIELAKAKGLCDRIKVKIAHSECVSEVQTTANAE